VSEVKKSGMLHGPNAAGELQTFSFENSVDLGRVLSKSRTLTLGDFGATLGGHSGQRSARLLCADSVAKLQKWGATNFPQMDLTSHNCRLMPSPGRYRTHL